MSNQALDQLYYLQVRTLSYQCMWKGLGELEP